MKALVDNRTAAIAVLNVHPDAAVPNGYHVVELGNDIVSQIGGNATYHLAPDNTLAIVPVTLPAFPDPPPNISEIISALLNSQSIDQPTKNALINALRGH